VNRLLVPGLVAVVLLGGCNITGSTKQAPPKTLSQGRFGYLVNRASRHFVCGVKHRGKATTFAKARVNLKKTLSAYERWLFTMRGLAPPASDAVPFNRLRAAMDRYDLLLHRLADAVDARQPQRVKTLVKQLHRLTARFDVRFGVRHRTHFACAKT
jgi:hypothetical protein